MAQIMSKAVSWEKRPAGARKTNEALFLNELDATMTEQ